MIGPDFDRLLAAAQNGDEPAFEALWREVNPSLVRYLRVVCGQAAEDLAAETWIGAIRGLRRFRGDESAWRGWLFTMARRRAVDEVRRRARGAPIVTTDVGSDDGVPVADSADEALTNLDTRAALAMVAQLPHMQAEVVMLRVVAGLDVERVAAVLGRSPGSIRVAAHRGLKTLARLLAEAGVTQ
ncbi:MAG TPA: RNA polymerase sigma factor [Jatrophihabitantaceae bacterium]|nr:RNA polymerase sigma factor [Jatrophihabitantaceae bacterium]